MTSRLFGNFNLPSFIKPAHHTSKLRGDVRLEQAKNRWEVMSKDSILRLCDCW